VLAENSAARRERAEAIKKLEEAIKGHGKEQVIERVAYIWFNRFCALRFMDVNRYNRVNIVSPADPGQFQPEILAEAKMGHIDEDMVHDKVRQQIFALLDGKAPSGDPQGKAYRLLVVAACNFWNKAMPFLFQRIDDYTELLMPDDLLSGNSILAYTREAMTPDACGAGSNQPSVISNQKKQDGDSTDDCRLMADGLAAAGGVEVIGWLYQFYISEKKDEVFDGLKKNKKITPENIPAATQLFTPHWIVRYLVENSLGRLWLLNRPGSKLVEQMDYYIKPEQAETDYLRISKPEEIKICDPACGSGHMLTYAFDLLYAIYEEEGYEPAEIPEKILTHNLYGIEIDERAGELAAFALTMKARAKQRRFFNKGVKPNICVLENVHFDEGELDGVISHQLSAVSKETKSAFLQDMKAFEEADNFGSLIRPMMTPEQIAEIEKAVTDGYKLNTDIFEATARSKILQALRQADYLSPKYHVVIANPPYMGGKGMNGRLKKWASENFPDSKSDLYAMFMERALLMTIKSGMVAMINMQAWMFLSTLENLRTKLLTNASFLTMAHIGARGFDSIGGEVVSTTAFVCASYSRPSFKGAYLRLVEGKNETDKARLAKLSISFKDGFSPYWVSPDDFRAIPGNPLAYWVTPDIRALFAKSKHLRDVVEAKNGITSGDNDIFLRLWHEVPYMNVSFTARNRDEADEIGTRWFPHNKGGSFRKWYGNAEYVLDWKDDGKALWAARPKATVRNPDYFFKPSVSWSDVVTGPLSFRFYPEGFCFDAAANSAFLDDAELVAPILALANNCLIREMAPILNPTMHFKIGDFGSFPAAFRSDVNLKKDVSTLMDLARADWNSYETSWDFTSLPLLNPDYRQSTLKATYQKLRAHWREMTLEMQRLEEENNRIFIGAYGLQDELTPEVPLNEITLTCNPHYRYGNDKSEDELEALLLADTMRELVSYAVGCMFGRYALDKPGLILANQGETIEDYLQRVPEPSFPADDDNVIPMLDGDWFTDDIAGRFREFLRVAFGEEHYEENLLFVEKSLNIKGKRNYSIRDYFLGEFYTDHVKRYKKRPIYWLFSSPKGSFNALIYMHRYRPDTVSVVLNDYLREFRIKLTSHKNHLEAVSISASSSQGEKTKALKEIEKITKMIAEMEEYEREVLYPLATEQVDIDLDDGVKVNYPKLGAALKRIDF
jgi:type II restriction/modification system DNA methylase subunit YeeA